LQKLPRRREVSSRITLIPSLDFDRITPVLGSIAALSSVLRSSESQFSFLLRRIAVFLLPVSSLIPDAAFAFRKENRAARWCCLRPKSSRHPRRQRGVVLKHGVTAASGDRAIHRPAPATPRGELRPTACLPFLIFLVRLPSTRDETSLPSYARLPQACRRAPRTGRCAVPSVPIHRVVRVRPVTRTRKTERARGPGCEAWHCETLAQAHKDLAASHGTGQQCARVHAHRSEAELPMRQRGEAAKPTAG